MASMYRQVEERDPFWAAEVLVAVHGAGVDTLSFAEMTRIVHRSALCSYPEAGAAVLAVLEPVVGVGWRRRQAKVAA